jgi:pullulanase/glycogen debranching enzyme
VGNFPPQWTEWNGKFRDTVREFSRGVRWRPSTSSPRTTVLRWPTWCHAHHEPIEFTLPPADFGKAWDTIVDTAAGPGETAESAPVKAAGPVRVESSAMVVLKALT